METPKQSILRKSIKKTLYLDNCCYNRLFDNRSVIKNYLEREAVLIILDQAFQNKIEIAGSQILELEMQASEDRIRRSRVVSIYNALFRYRIALSDDIFLRAEKISSLSGAKNFDSLHVASAEKIADIFLTTDRKLVNCCNRISLNITVMNPIDYLIGVPL